MKEKKQSLIKKKGYINSTELKKWIEDNPSSDQSAAQLFKLISFYEDAPKRIIALAMSAAFITKRNDGLYAEFEEDLYMKCMTNVTLKEFDNSVKTAYQYFFRNETKRRLLTEFLCGSTVSEISTKFDTNRTNVDRVICRLVKKLRSPEFVELVKMLLDGVTTPEELKALNSTQNDILKQLKSFVTRPFEKYEDAVKVFQSCELAIPENANKETVCEIAGYLFNCIKVTQSIGARMKYEGFSNLDIYKYKEKYNILTKRQRESTTTPDFKSEKRAFYTFVRNNPDFIHEKLSHKYPYIYGNVNTTDESSLNNDAEELNVSVEEKKKSLFKRLFRLK